MNTRYALLGILLASAGAIVQAQTGRTKPQSTATDRSFYSRQSIDHPETPSGLWEASDGHGGAIGIHLLMMTVVPLHTDPPIWSPQSSVSLDVSVYQRTGSEFASGNENSLSGLPNGSQLTLEHGHLRSHFMSDRATLPSIDLDLVKQTDDCWHGRLHRGAFDSFVKLCRPSASVGNPRSSLVGTWASNFNVLGCMHIFANGQGGFAGWSDVLQVPGRIAFNPKGSGPQTLLEQYGSLLNIRQRKDGFVGIDFHASDDLYHVERFVGLLSSDGSKLVGGLVSDDGLIPPVQNVRAWTKVSGGSCVDPAQVRNAVASETNTGRN
jgi:hypothetical protein